MWSFIRRPANRAALGWLGGGIVAAATGTWAVVTYIWPHHVPASVVCAQQGIAIGGNVSGSTVTNTGSGTTNPCAESRAPK